MNKSVLRTTLVVIVCMLAFEYILKFFVPQEFVLVVSNPNLIRAGQFIEKYPILEHFSRSIMSFITYYLFTCACSKRKYLSFKIVLIMLVLILTSALITEFAYQYSTPFLVCSMIFMAFISGSDMKTFTIVFVTHTLAQNLSLSIRSLTTYIVSFDILSCFMLTFECYLWLLLFYILNCYNIKEREVN